MSQKTYRFSIVQIQVLLCLLLLLGSVWIKQTHTAWIPDCCHAYLELFWEDAGALPEPIRFVQETPAETPAPKKKDAQKEKTQPSAQPETAADQRTGSHAS